MKAASITDEQYLKDQLSKVRKMDTLEEIIKNIKNLRQYKETNIHSNKYHNGPVYIVPFLETTNSYAEEVH